jgi:riboflavin kinase
MGEFMKIVISGRVQPGKNDASHWLGKFNGPYSKKTGMAIFPGSLNLGLNQNFDWFAPIYSPKIVWFGKNEYGGERDILLLPCTLTNLANRCAFLWTTTTAARDQLAPSVEIITDVDLRKVYGLMDGSIVYVELDL